MLKTEWILVFGKASLLLNFHVHLMFTAETLPSLGLLNRKQNDQKAVEELDLSLRDLTLKTP